jgi:UDP:flavonoid glycosyltransferase YjiC (YdhE family)
MTPSCLLVCWAGGGNVNPFLGLSEQLRQRGYRVGAVATPSLLPRLEAAGIGTTIAAQGWLPNAEDVLAAVQTFSPDVLVVDFMLTHALCGARAAGPPTVALVHTLYNAVLVDDTPYPMFMAAPLEAVNDVRAGLGLTPIATLGALLAEADLVLVTAPRELDVAGELPANVDYCGALFEGAGADTGWSPPAGGGPLVAVSVGTAGDPAIESALLERVLSALSQLPVKGFVSLPDYLDHAAFDPPDNVTLAGYVRHPAVLPHAATLVTHAGLGSVLAALTYGVPMVCLPLDREQPANAAAVERIGAGRALSPDAGADEIAAAIQEQLDRSTRVTIQPTPTHAAARIDMLSSD